ncbi:hypothetical protein [uncultured Paludibaculum sp.]|uniref:hypothetical protein n=1 Tax=uncultured Paludibaculum sp. TaxID=1765020 RepID=UPI002AAAFA80|nr:hypothetical protein [uncultured Paludibaculum sp.]
MGTPPIRAQRRINGRVVVAIVPLIGAGTADDPRRPKFVPGPKEKDKGDALNFRFTLSDDGQWAIVAFSTSHPTAENLKLLDDIEGDKESGGFAADAAKARKSDLESEIRKKKKDFDFDELMGLAEPKEKK